MSAVAVPTCSSVLLASAHLISTSRPPLSSPRAVRHCAIPADRRRLWPTPRSSPTTPAVRLCQLSRSRVINIPPSTASSSALTADTCLWFVVTVVVRATQVTAWLATSWAPALDEGVALPVLGSRHTKCLVRVDNGETRHVRARLFRHHSGAQDYEFVCEPGRSAWPAMERPGRPRSALLVSMTRVHGSGLCGELGTLATVIG